MLLSKFFFTITILVGDYVWGDTIIVETNYGLFQYKVDDMKVIKETDYDAFKINKDKEELILYTCYPLNQYLGRKTKRYVVYASLEVTP